jgi:coenzyme F420-reducing hydrogenase alpha subunit
MSRLIRVDYLARVEGEGSLYIEIDDNRVARVEVGIFEPPRFFEAFLRGRKYYEVPDITARICGICPIAYIMSSSRALEKVLGIEVPEELKILRKIAYLGEWIESHVLHILMLHASDFLGYESFLGIAREYPEIVKMGLKLKNWGNQVVKVIGGRSVHPVSFRVGGFYRVIRRDELDVLLRDIEDMKRYAKNFLEWVLKLPIPEVKQDIEFVSLRGVKEYPVLFGDVVSSKGLNISEDVFENHIIVEQTKYSTSLRYKLRGRGPYMVGPLARYNNNYELLAAEVQDIVELYGYRAPLYNSFQSIVARAAEVYHAVIEIENLVKRYIEPKQPYIDGIVKEGVGVAITEAPRGMLYHRYEINSRGYIVNANIIPPTAQNLAQIEQDLLALSDKLTSLELSKAQWLAEQVVRNYDPCISCSTHFLKIVFINNKS